MRNMQPTRIVTLTKVRGLNGDLLNYTFPAPGRRRFVGKERVPPFEGESATFEREAGCPWPRWRVVRRLYQARGRPC